MIKDWVKNNWIFIGIVLFAIGIRIYYFVLTSGQALWWDSSEYMNMANRFAFGTDYTFGPVRPILMSSIFSLFLKISNTELLPRLFMLFISVLSVIGIYYLGKEVVNKRVGLISAFLMSIFYLNLFFTYRLLVDLPSLTFFIFSALFFYKYHKTKSGKFLYLAAFIVGVGMMFKLSTAFILIPFFIFILVTDIQFLKRKEIWISLGVFLATISPYIIWGYFEFGGFVLSQASAHVAPENYFNFFGILKNYFLLFPTYFSWITLIAFSLGLLFMYKIIIYFDLLIKGDEKMRSDFYLFLIFIIPLILVSILINHNENRYIITVFPAVMIIAGSFLDKIYKLIREKNKIIAILSLVLLLSFAGYYQLNSADDLIKGKITTYGTLKGAGLWIDNNLEDSIIATRSQPQTKYYSGMNVIGIPPTEEEFEEWRKEFNPKYFMVSVFESHPQWSLSYGERNNLSVVQAYVTPDNQPILVIYKLK